MAETSEDKKTDEIPVEDAAKVKPEQVDSEATQSSTDEQSNVEAVPMEKTDNSDSDDAGQSKQDNEPSKGDDKPSRKDDEPSRKDDRQDSRDGGRRGGGYRHERGARGEMSFEEKMRAFKKQSDERLHHIKRSREAKIGKKRTR